jgi:hypothetical protein
MIAPMNDSIIHQIKQETKINNRDNITRTKAYLQYYQNFQEIKWSFLASMVSRNAGWNITDLATNTYQQLLSKKVLHHLFMTYERANWFIFSDAYPQLLIYQYSIKHNEPLFHLLKYFHISTFMMSEWIHFWEKKDKNRLLKAQIINEQNLIQKPVVQEPYFKYKVFRSVPYLLQDKVHLNSVLFPTYSGELYGLFIKNFTNLTNRIKIGKMLSSILFHPDLHKHFVDFAHTVEPTGKREEYEAFFDHVYIETDYLEDIFPNITHENHHHEDWFLMRSFKEKWWKDVVYDPQNIADRFYKKRRMIRNIVEIKNKIVK